MFDTPGGDLKLGINRRDELTSYVYSRYLNIDCVDNNGPVLPLRCRRLYSKNSSNNNNK